MYDMISKTLTCYIAADILYLQYGKTALIKASKYGHIETVRLVLDKNANVHAVDVVRK